jgi:hypothetical protein
MNHYVQVLNIFQNNPKKENIKKKTHIDGR